MELSRTPFRPDHLAPSEPPAARRMRRFDLRRFAFAAFLLPFLASSPAVEAQESFQVVSVDTLGCINGAFGMTVLRSNLDGGSYTLRTVVTVGALIYMNEGTAITVNGNTDWNVFDFFNYGAVPNQGTYPIPAGQQMQLDFTLERPTGTILYAWRLIVDGCDTGNILFNGPLEASVLAIPTLSPGGLAALGAGILLAFAWVRRRTRVAERL